MKCLAKIRKAPAVEQANLAILKGKIQFGKLSQASCSSQDAPGPKSDFCQILRLFS
jgi:hypothetical protein